MDVHLHSVGNRLAVAQGKKSPADKASPEAARTTPGEAQEASLTLTSLTASLASVPVVDSAKVQKVASAVQSGHYQIDPHKVAEKIIAFEDRLP
jgi:flagellar biosynthesis anti-sigma factor FlgM